MLRGHFRFTRQKENAPIRFEHSEFQSKSHVLTNCYGLSSVFSDIHFYTAIYMACNMLYGTWNKYKFIVKNRILLRKIRTRVFPAGSNISVLLY